MVSQIRIETWCDACRAEDPESAEPAESQEVQLGKLARSLDLCERHQKQLLQPLLELMQTAGQTVRSPTAPKPPKPRQPSKRPGAHSVGAAPAPCLWCPEVFPTQGGLSSHLMTNHQLTSSIAGAYGDRCPWCGKGTGSKSMTGHLRNAHPDSPINRPQAFLAARDAGDPAGVVAKLLAPQKPTRKR